MENLSLSVPDLLKTVKKFVNTDKHELLDAMLQRYMRKDLCKQQLQLELRQVAGRDALRQALLAMVPQIDDLQRKREQMKAQQARNAAYGGQGQQQQGQQQRGQQQQQLLPQQPPQLQPPQLQQQQPPTTVPQLAPLDLPKPSSFAPGNGTEALKLESLGPLQAVKTENAAPAPLTDTVKSETAVKQELGAYRVDNAVKQELGGYRVKHESSSSQPYQSIQPSACVNGTGSTAPGCNASAAAAVAPGSSGRKSTLPVQALVHAFHCTDVQCVHKTCPETKQVLKRMEAHVHQCPVRQQASQQNLPPECKVCKLWHALHRTRTNNIPPVSTGQTMAAPRPSAPPIQPRPGLPAAARPNSMQLPPTSATGYSSSQNSTTSTDAVRQKLRQLDPAAVKRMLLQHVRSCQNKQCHTCHKLRERIKASRVASQAAHQGTMPLLANHVGKLERQGSMNASSDLSMHSSWNPLASSSFGNFNAAGTSFNGSSGGTCAADSIWGNTGQMPAYPAQANVGPRPGAQGQQQGGQRRNKVKQRGREGGGGLAVASRRQISSNLSAPAEGLDSTRFAKVRLKLRGHSPNQQKSGEKKSSHKKRTAKEDEGEIQRPAAKRSRSDNRKVVEAEEEPDLTGGAHQVKHAKDRPPELENNRFEPGQLVEIFQAHGDNQDWRLAVVRAYNESSGYTIQMEPIESNRHKQTGVTFQQLRFACMHKSCRRHQLLLAALPLFCDRCKNSLMQSPQRRGYYQESPEAADKANAANCIRLCNTCYGSLNTELTKRGERALMEEVGKFAGERVTSFSLDAFNMCNVPQRSDDGDGPILSADLDARWVQCEACHKWWHWMCGMYNDQQYKHGRPYYCMDCRHLEPTTGVFANLIEESRLNNDAENLTQIPMGKFIEEQVAADIVKANVRCEPVSIRIVSSLLMTSDAPERLVQHQERLGIKFPAEFPYKSKALLAFQKNEGLDVCLFALYVQEYGSDCPEPNRNRVYISYLDSVRYFTSDPPGHRSTVYHAVLVAYLQWTRMLGFKYVHIWVEPPKMGDEYIFFARSDQQRKPMKREKLREWYKRMLEKAVAKGIVASYGSMHETFKDIKSLAEIPLFHGDQWEMTVPSLLGIDSDDPLYDPKKVPVDKLVRMDSKDVVQKAQQEMHHLKRHFLVVVLADPDGAPQEDKDPVISSDLTDSRQTFLGHCQLCHWQFNTLRHAQYSTMMILNHIHNKPSYCMESCSRGRVEDGSFMVGCDMCDNWYHGDCIGISKDDANSRESWICQLCMSLEDGGSVTSSTFA